MTANPVRPVRLPCANPMSEPVCRIPFGAVAWHFAVRAAWLEGRKRCADGGAKEDCPHESGSEPQARSTWNHALASTWQEGFEAEALARRQARASKACQQAASRRPA